MNIKIVTLTNDVDFYIEYYINDSRIEDLNNNTLKQVIHALIDKENSREMLVDIIEDLVRNLGETRSIEKKMLETTSSIEL